MNMYTESTEGGCNWKWSMYYLLPPGVVASRNAEVDVHAQSLTQPHSDIVVAKKRLRRIALKKCDDVSICSHQML